MRTLRLSKLPPKPAVSVAMCTYNGEKYLRFQLDSILRQTNLPDELVVCDDRSTDGTMVLLEEFKRRAPFPVHLHRNEQTLRPAQNFARCVSLCSGDIIMLSDQDDIWFPDRVAQTRDAFLRDAQTAYTYSDAPFLDDGGVLLNRSLYSTLPVTPADKQRLEQGGNLWPVLRRCSVLCGATMAFRAELKAALLPVPALWMHDEWIGLVGNAWGKAARLPAPAIQYRQHAQQQVGTGAWSASDQAREARGRTLSYYQHEVDKQNHGIAQLRAQAVAYGELLKIMEARRQYFTNRLAVQQRGMRALPLACGMLLAGRYRRYGSGVRSAVKDMSMALRRSLPAPEMAG